MFVTHMGVVSYIRRAIHRTREAAGLVFYMRTRRFPVCYDVTVKNASEAAQRFFLAVPVPPNTEQQEVLHVPMFSPRAADVLTDGRYGNRYAVLQGELKPGEVASFQESFVMLVKPFKYRSARRFFLEDYRDSPSEAARRYRAPNRFVQSDDARIRRLAEELRGPDTDAVSVLRRLNRYVVTRLKYGDPIVGLYSSADALTRKYVDCGGFDALLSALAMSLGIPARIVSGFWAAGKTKNDMHAWVEFRLPDGTWMPADPSVEHLARHGRTKKSGRFGFVGSDRVVLSYGCEVPLELGGRTVYADILQHPYVWSEQGARGLITQVEFRIPKEFPI